MFNALLVNKNEESYSAEITELHEDTLPAGDVTVDIQYSSLNYKDGLAITGRSPVVRTFPMIPGIDLIGTVAASSHAAYQVGDSVILNGWGVGESHWGGLSQKGRFNGDWLVPLPDAFSAEQAMAVGTAGYTAMLCILAIEQHGVTPQDGDILVTGAAGGVGSVAVAILAKLGYRVVALSGRPQEAEYLYQLGAKEIIPRSDMAEKGRPLAKERWAGVVDVVGSHVLANACASTQYGGIVTACGLAGGMDLPATVAPFILRGVTLAGIDSVMCPRVKRLAAWQRLAQDLDVGMLGGIANTVSLSEVPTVAAQLLDGKVRGRVIVDVNR